MLNLAHHPRLARATRVGREQASFGTEYSRNDLICREGNAPDKISTDKWNTIFNQHLSTSYIGTAVTDT